MVLAAAGLASLFLVSFAGRPAAQPAAQPAEPPGAIDGAALFGQRCAACHEDREGNRAPSVRALGYLQPAQIFEAVTNGAMKAQGAGLSADEVRAIAGYITNPRRAAAAPLPDPDLKANLCGFAPPPVKLDAPGAWNGWAPDVANTRFQRTPGFKPSDLPRMRRKWVFAVPGGRTSSPPAAIGDRLFLVSSGGVVFALDARSGCTFWTAQVPDGGTKSPPVVARPGKGPTLVYVGGGR